MNLLFDISDTSNQNYIINYFLASSDETIENIGSKAAGILNKILQEGITEKMFEKDNINKIIFRNMQHNISKSQIRVISALLEQVIMPNMIVDEQATEKEKKKCYEFCESSNCEV